MKRPADGTIQERPWDIGINGNIDGISYREAYVDQKSENDGRSNSRYSKFLDQEASSHRDSEGADGGTDYEDRSQVLSSHRILTQGAGIGLLEEKREPKAAKHKINGEGNGYTESRRCRKESKYKAV